MKPFNFTAPSCEYHDGECDCPEPDTDGVPVEVEPETAEKVLARLERQNEATARLMSGLCLPARAVALPAAVRSVRGGNA